MSLFTCLLLVGKMELPTPHRPMVGLISYPDGPLAGNYPRLSGTLITSLLDTGLKYPAGFK